MTFMPFTDQWKSQRKLLHTMTQPRAATTYEPIQAEESAQLVRDMLRAPQDYWSHCQRYAGSTIMQIAFNKRALSISDPAIVDMRRINEQMTKTAVPGRYLVDSVPILNYVPERFASWKREASTLFEDTLRLFRSHVEDVCPLFSPTITSLLTLLRRSTAKSNPGAT
jgi:cytochrome P450